MIQRYALVWIRCKIEPADEGDFMKAADVEVVLKAKDEEILELNERKRENYWHVAFQMLRFLMEEGWEVERYRGDDPEAAFEWWGPQSKRTLTRFFSPWEVMGEHYPEDDWLAYFKQITTTVCETRTETEEKS